MQAKTKIDAPEQQTTPLAFEKIEKLSRRIAKLDARGPHRVESDWNTLKERIDLLRDRADILMQRELVFTGVAMCSRGMVKQLGITETELLFTMAWAFDQGDVFWRKHYRENRSLYVWARMMLKECRASMGNQPGGFAAILGCENEA